MSILIVIALLVIAIAIFMQQPQFGKQPEGARLERIKQSPNYRGGKFQNLSHTPDLAEGTSYYTVFKEFFFGKEERNKPKDSIPTKKEDLLQLDPEENILVWFGHSSYFMQADGKTILVDPVFSGSVSPISFTNKAYPGSDAYTVEDLPEIDILFISHDHWDHLDYETVLKLKPKVKKVITGLGTAQHLEYWGYDTTIIEEKDWGDHVDLGDGFTVDVTPARHFSGRSFTRNKALWVSFVFKTPSMKLFLGGDSGYDYFFKEIGDKYGPFDLAILECGQYNEYWKYIHMMPEQVAQAATDLKAQRLMPVHWSKFSLALHAWDESIKTVTEAAAEKDLPLLTPMIGEKVNIIGEPVKEEWWNTIE
ncbi:beta-lactamase [Flavobacterium beibuense F44-8]|uniref:Beta-lactamase n=1 Tax=Flavobacterium beibuense F44-8 TaxID=1406840 RepID=A0A0A2M4G4_9FLAO|nr:MBL fold metallo-hydrolase [Flavobacterium beibuense]KGO83190.1 beta-lactamase [Flavobacterium beibuense F44-8]